MQRNSGYLDLNILHFHFTVISNGFFVLTLSLNLNYMHLYQQCQKHLTKLLGQTNHTKTELLNVQAYSITVMGTVMLKLISVEISNNCVPDKRTFVIQFACPSNKNKNLKTKIENKTSFVKTGMLQNTNNKYNFSLAAEI